MNYGAWMVPWIERERGWGERPDGFWYYPSQEAAQKHTAQIVVEMRAREKKEHGGRVPDIYSSPEDVRFVAVSQQLAERIEKEGKVYCQKRGG